MNQDEAFSSRFGGQSDFNVRSPGRVNLIGEHVDYNDGYVLPIAVSMHTQMSVRARDDRRVVLYSPLFDSEKSFSLDHLEKQGAWVDYAQGVAGVLQDKGAQLRGFEAVVASDVPLASGLSSSASFEVAVALAFERVSGLHHSPTEIALLCQKAENGFVGVNSGIMDQMAVAACQKDHALFLDCRDISMRQVPFVLRDFALVVMDSDAPRELAGSAYNERRAQCEQGLSLLQRWYPEAKSLRDISPNQFALHTDELPETICKRLAHVVGEIARTLEAVHDLEAGDMVKFGRKMNESHASLRDLYEVTSFELDFLTDWARKQPEVLGSRMTGAGFGGCTVTLLERARAHEFIERCIHDYRVATDREARGWICEAEAGAEILD